MKTKVIKSKVDLPSGVDAEKWIDPDTFLYKGEYYRITPDIKIVKVDISLKKA